MDGIMWEQQENKFRDQHRIRELEAQIGRLQRYATECEQEAQRREPHAWVVIDWTGARAKAGIMPGDLDPITQEDQA